MEEVLGLTGAQRRGSDSLKVTQQARTRDGLQAKDLSTKTRRTTSFKGLGGVCPQEFSHRLGGPCSLTITPSSSISSLPLIRDSQPRTLLTWAAVGAGASPQAGTEPPDTGEKRRSHRGGQFSPTPTRIWGGGELADSNSLRCGFLAVRGCRGRSAPQQPPKQKTRLGGGGRRRRAAHAPWVAGSSRGGEACRARSLAAPPRKLRVFRAVPCGGGGEGQKGDRGHLRSASSQKGLGEDRWFLEAALTAAAAVAAATFAAAATA